MSATGTPETTSGQAIRSYLKATLEHLLAMERSTHDLVAFSLDKFGKSIIPHLKEFQEDVQDYRVQIGSLADSTRTAIFGIHVTPEQRVQLIREAAYRRAETRGFAGGSAEDDWYAAEREIDDLLAKQAGLLAEARKTAASATDIAEKELLHVKDTVNRWIASRREEGKETR